MLASKATEKIQSREKKNGKEINKQSTQGNFQSRNLNIRR